MAVTPKAIELLTLEAERNMTVQVINLRKMKTTNRLSCELSDGQYKIRAYITDEKVNESNNALILAHNLAFI